MSPKRVEVVWRYVSDPNGAAPPAVAGVAASDVGGVCAETPLAAKSAEPKQAAAAARLSVRAFARPRTMSR